MKPNKIYLRPLISEKTVDLAGKNCYTFLVDAWASKSQVFRAIVEHFHQKPVKVNLLSKPVKEVRRLRRKPGTTRRYKKALVFMPPGVKLPGFEVAEAKEEPGKKATEKVKESNG